MNDTGPDGSPPATCTADAHCGDTSLFCSQWRCRPGEAGTDARGCIDLGSPCASGVDCDEDEDTCTMSWCTEGRDGCLEPGDCDGDGARHELQCGGDDCDDDDPDRFPGNPEVCDAEGHDEDCNLTTFAGAADGDLDGDGYISAACCNGDACGDDCDDSDVNVNPAATEVCDGIDNDCSGAADDADGLCPGGICAGGRCDFDGWARAMGGTSNDEAIDVAIDGAGAVYVSGEARGTVDFGMLEPLTVEGPGPAVFVAKFGPNGAPQWAYLSRGGNITAQLEPRLAVSPDGADVYVVGYGSGIDFGSGSANGGFLLRLAGADGTYRGDSRFSTARFRSATADAGGVVVGGWFSGTADFGGPEARVARGAGSAVVARFDSSGAHEWDAVLHVAGTASSRLVQVDAIEANGDGSVRIGGSYSGGMLDLGGTSLPAPTASRSFGFLASLDGSGALTRARGLTSDTGRVEVHDIANAPTGRTYVTGSFTSGLTTGAPCTWFTATGPATGPTCNAGVTDGLEVNGFVVAFDAAGEPSWARAFGGPTGADYGRSVALDTAENVALVGSFGSRTDFGGGWLEEPRLSDGFLARYTSAGGYLSSERYASGGYTRVRAIAIGPGGSTAIVGMFEMTTHLGGTTITSRGVGDAFVLRLGS